MPTTPPTHKVKRARGRRPDNRPASRQRRFKGGWPQTRRRVIERDNGICQASDCGRVCGGHKEAHIDHIIPHAAGGTDDLDNLQLLCASCHARKTAWEIKNGMLR